MELTLTGRAEEIVQEAVARGEYASAAEMLEDVLVLMESLRAPEFKLTPEAEARVAAGMDEAERGEGRPWREVVAELEAEIRRDS